MNKRKIINYLIVISILSLVFIINSCNNSHDRYNQIKGKVVKTVKNEDKIGKVVFFLENSESMFGYVNGLTEYVDVVSELSQKSQFAAQKTKREFYFINGSNPLKINEIGTKPIILVNKLNRVGFNCGNIKQSNLNKMFQIALFAAQHDTISILISDAIYDVGQQISPLSALVIEGRDTKNKFIERLQGGDLQTLLIKLTSKFDGNYFYSSHRGIAHINQSRPFYIWIFGRSELLNNYFPEDYISHNLKGYENYDRFNVYKNNILPYQITSSINRIGDFRLDHIIKNKITNAQPTRDNKFQFSIAVDFSSLQFSESYLTRIENYSCSNPNFKIMKIAKITNSQKHEVTTYKNPTHILTIYTEKNPSGHLEIVLKNETPNWIKDTDAKDEVKINNNQTYGFGPLTNSISEAYSYMNDRKIIANFKMEISK